jgi:hypothetical protein
LVSPARRTGSTCQSRKSKARKHVASMVANFRPRQARGPGQDSETRFQLGGGWQNLPTLNAEIFSESAGRPYHRDGLYISGSSK